VVFGPYGSGPALAAAAASKGVVWDHGGATARLARPAYPRVVNGESPAYRYLAAVLETLVAEGLGEGSEVVIMYVDTGFGREVAEGAAMAARRLALTGIDDHSRLCVCARLMARERTRSVCDGLRAALATYGAPEQILTDNGKVFTGRFSHPPVEVLFEAICREHGIEHLLTQPRSPTTTGKIERFHRSLRAEFLSSRTPFTNLKTAQQALDEWVDDYNAARPHQALKMATPAQRFYAGAPTSPPSNSSAGHTDRGGDDWVSRRVCANGIVCVSWQ
jgi:transposase InsO family protein